MDESSSDLCGKWYRTKLSKNNTGTIGEEYFVTEVTDGMIRARMKSPQGLWVRRSMDRGAFLGMFSRTPPGDGDGGGAVQDDDQEG